MLRVTKIQKAREEIKANVNEYIFKTHKNGRVSIPCNRCGGSGRYSWCQKYGSECFACMDNNGNGTGIGKVFSSIDELIEYEAQGLVKRQAAQKRAQNKYKKFRSQAAKNISDLRVNHADMIRIAFKCSQIELVNQIKYKSTLADLYFNARKWGMNEKQIKLAYNIIEWDQESQKRKQKWAEEKQKEIEAREAHRALSDFQYEEGEKVDIEVTLKAQISVNTQWGNSTIYLFEDENNNCYKWFTSSCATIGKDKDGMSIFPEEGQKLRLNGKVKGHEEYNGQKQTCLIRVKLKQA